MSRLHPLSSDFSAEVCLSTADVGVGGVGVVVDLPLKKQAASLAASNGDGNDYSDDQSAFIDELKLRIDEKRRRRQWRLAVAFLASAALMVSAGSFTAVALVVGGGKIALVSLPGQTVSGDSGGSETGDSHPRKVGSEAEEEVALALTERHEKDDGDLSYSFLYTHRRRGRSRRKRRREEEEQGPQLTEEEEERIRCWGQGC